MKDLQLAPRKVRGSGRGIHAAQHRHRFHLRASAAALRLPQALTLTLWGCGPWALAAGPAQHVAVAQHGGRKQLREGQRDGQRRGRHAAVAHAAQACDRD